MRSFNPQSTGSSGRFNNDTMPAGPDLIQEGLEPGLAPSPTVKGADSSWCWNPGKRPAGLAVLGLTLILSGCSINSRVENNSASVDVERTESGLNNPDWPESVLAAHVPRTALPVKVTLDAESELALSFQQASEADYEEYKEKCVERGYTVDAISWSSSYDAYDESGYLVEIFYNAASEEMIVRLTAPVRLEETKWPTDGLGVLLPEPYVGDMKRVKGKVVQDTEDKLIIILHLDEEQFDIYAQSCIDEGFSENLSQSVDRLKARDKDGHILLIRKDGVDQYHLELTTAS